MLTIKRVPTVVSLHQEDSENQGCGKECLGSCCITGQDCITVIFLWISAYKLESLTGSSLPLFSFARRYAIKPQRIRSFGDLHSVPEVFAISDSSSDSEDDPKSALDSILTSEVRSSFSRTWCFQNWLQAFFFQWEDRMERGLFRYDVTACMTKVKMTWSLLVCLDY